MPSCSTLRGVSRHCPTLKALWASQEVTDIVSKVAGLPLVPVMDYELGVCNVQVGGQPSLACAAVRSICMPGFGASSHRHRPMNV